MPSQNRSGVPKSFPDCSVSEHLFPYGSSLFPILEVSGLPSAFAFKSIGFLLNVAYFFNGLDWKGLIERGALGRAQRKVNERVIIWA